MISHRTLSQPVNRPGKPWRAALFVLACVAFAACDAVQQARAAEPREENGFGSNPGNLRMFSYLPDGLPDTPALIVVLHGCKQTAGEFARDGGWLALADRAKAALLLPEQKGLPRHFHDVYMPPWMVAMGGANNQNGCFNWFEPGDQARNRGEALSIRQMIEVMIARHKLDRRRVYIAGFSAGAAMAAVMLAVYPELFAGGAIVAGVSYGCAATVFEALRCMDPGIDRSPGEWRHRVLESAGAGAHFPPVTIWQGSADRRVVPGNQRELVEQWLAVHDIGDRPARVERSRMMTRTQYLDADGAVQVESVLVQGLRHAFPIDAAGARPCGRASEFVSAVGICAARDIAHFWGFTSD